MDFALTIPSSPTDVCWSLEGHSRSRITGTAARGIANERAPAQPHLQMKMLEIGLRRPRGGAWCFLLAAAVCLIATMGAAPAAYAQTTPTLTNLTSCGRNCIQKSAITANCRISTGAVFPDVDCACASDFVFADSLTDCLTSDECADGSNIIEYQMVSLSILSLWSVEAHAQASSHSAQR